MKRKEHASELHTQPLQSRQPGREQARRRSADTPRGEGARDASADLREIAAAFASVTVRGGRINEEHMKIVDDTT